MKYKKLKLASILLLYIIIFNKNTEAHTVDKIMAIVDDDVILKSDIKNKQLFNTKHHVNYLDKKNNNLPIKKTILDQLISDMLILQLAKQAHLSLNNEQINNIIKYIAKENHMTKKEFKSYLTKNNINYTTYKNYIKNDTIINTIRDYEMHQRIKISSYELDTLTNILILKNNNIAFKLEHILIPIQENPTNYQIQKAYSLCTFLIKEMRYGINTKTLMKLYSNDKKYPTIQNNTINWSTIQELPTLFSEYLIKDKMNINNIIGPIYSNIGFHILKIKDIDNPIKKNITTKVHIRHIFIKQSNINDNQTIKNKLLNIKNNIKNNSTTFSIEAQQISEDPYSSQNGGDLGWKYLEDFDKIFQISIKYLKKGEISDPIKDHNGWYLIQLISNKQIDKNIISYQEKAYQIIFNHKLHEEMNHWIKELKTLTYIKTFKDHEK